MKRLFYIICTLLSYISSSAQVVSYNNIDDQVNYYLDQGLFVNASNTLVDLAHIAGNEGDSVSALNFQMANLLLVDDHVEYFKSKGLNDDAYFANWYVTITLASALNKKNIAIPMFIKMLQKVDYSHPFTRLPSYVRSLMYLLYDCKDPSYKDSIFLIQKTLNVIKQLLPTKELVNQYISICNSFFINRFNNSLDGPIFVEDRLADCENWFCENKGYIDGLDTYEYKSEIAQFYLNYCDNVLSLRASGYSAQKGDYETANTLLNNEITILNNIASYREDIRQKIAACYASIAGNYLQQENIPLAKINADNAFSFLYNHEDNIEYCTILSNLAKVYWFTHNSEVAAKLKLEAILTQEKLGYEVLCSDYCLYLLYNSKDTLSTISTAENIIDKFGETDVSMDTVFELLGEAYSKQMYTALKSDTISLAKLYRHKAEFYFEKAEKTIEKHYNFLNDYNLFANSIAGLYNKRSQHYARIGDLETAYIYATKAVQTWSAKRPNIYSTICAISSVVHNREAIATYLPLYYKGITHEIKQMLPLLGSVEGETYLQYGDNNIYRIAEFASWNPLDSICVRTAFDAALLSKGLLLQVSSLASYIKDNPLLGTKYDNLMSFRDSIINNINPSQRVQMAHHYEIEERALRLSFLNDIEKSLSLSWRDVQKALSDNDVAIEIVSYQANNWSWSTDSVYEQYTAFIIDKEHENPLVVNLLKHEDLVSAYDNQPHSYSTDNGMILYHKIWDTLDPYIKGKSNIYISPVGMLSMINLESLTDESGLTAFEKYNIHRLSSTRQICGRYSDKPKLDRVALFGGINYDDYDFSPSIPLDSLNTRGNWAYLSSTKEEIETIKHGIENVSSHTVLFSGKDATEKSLKKISHESPDILHLATHGYFIPKNKRDDIPYFKNSDVIKNIDDNLYYSGLAFANGEMNWKDGSFSLEANDGVLSAYEISKLNLSNTDLVVLSACETALGDRTFDGISGLQRAFKLAGVQTIIMSLWKVDDLATSFFMKVFYEGMIETNSKREAFIRAQKLTREKFEDPYYWAAFIMLD